MTEEGGYDLDMRFNTDSSDYLPVQLAAQIMIRKGQHFESNEFKLLSAQAIRQQFGPVPLPNDLLRSALALYNYHEAIPIKERVDSIFSDALNFQKE